MSTEFKFPKSKTIHEAIFEIAVDTHSLFCPFWQIFLPVYNLPSILASWIVLLFANLNSIDIPIANVQVRICWTFFTLRYLSWVIGAIEYRNAPLERSVSPFPRTPNACSILSE